MPGRARQRWAGPGGPSEPGSPRSHAKVTPVNAFQYCCGCALCHCGIALLKNPEYVRTSKEILTFLCKTEPAGTLKRLSSVSTCRTLTRVLACSPRLTQHSESRTSRPHLRWLPQGLQPALLWTPAPPDMPGQAEWAEPQAHFCRLLSSNAPVPGKQAWPKADPGRWEPLVSGYMNPSQPSRAPSRPLPSPPRLVSPGLPTAQLSEGLRAGCDGWQGRLHPPAPVLQTFLQQINRFEWPPPQWPGGGALLKGRR